MPQKRAHVLGIVYDLGVLAAADVRPGTLVYCKHARRAYRIVAADGGEMILRNMRYPSMLDVATPEWLQRNCQIMTLADDAG